MPGGKGDKKEGESSGDENSKKRTASPDDNNDGSDSQDSGRRSRRKKARVTLWHQLFFYSNTFFIFISLAGIHVNKCLTL